MLIWMRHLRGWKQSGARNQVPRRAMNWKFESLFWESFRGIALLVLLALCTNPGTAQEIPSRYAAPGIEITVTDDVYVIKGNTADELLLAMRAMRPGGGLGRISAVLEV